MKADVAPSSDEIKARKGGKCYVPWIRNNMQMLKDVNKRK